MVSAAPPEQVEFLRTVLDENPTLTPSDGFKVIPESLTEIPAPPEHILPVFELPGGITAAVAGRVLEAQVEDALKATGMSASVLVKHCVCGLAVLAVMRTLASSLGLMYKIKHTACKLRAP